MESSGMLTGREEERKKLPNVTMKATGAAPAGDRIS